MLIDYEDANRALSKAKPHKVEAVSIYVINPFHIGCLQHCYSFSYVLFTSSIMIMCFTALSSKCASYCTDYRESGNSSRSCYITFLGFFAYKKFARPNRDANA